MGFYAGSYRVETAYRVEESALCKLCAVNNLPLFRNPKFPLWEAEDIPLFRPGADAAGPGAISIPKSGVPQHLCKPSLFLSWLKLVPRLRASHLRIPVRTTSSSMIWRGKYSGGIAQCKAQPAWQALWPRVASRVPSPVR
jgi:hypothetical protein